MRYKAFISYSHSHRELARALQNSLHRFGTPWYERVGAKIFRDESGLAASPDLWEVLRAALDESEYFVFLASPESVDSGWVIQEVDYWLANRDPNHIILVLAAGSLQWDPNTGVFDPKRTDALPQPLCKAFLRVPLFVDFREVVQTGYRLSDPIFRDRVAGIAAALHGKSKDELYGMQVAALIVSDAERMAAGAEIALGERLADRALLLGVHALRVTEAHGEARVPEGEAALRRTMCSTGGRPLGVVDKRAGPPFSMSEDGRWLCTVHADGTRVWDLAVANQERFDPSALCQFPTPDWVQLSTDGSWLVAMKNASRKDPAAALELWRLGPDGPRAVPLDLKHGIPYFADVSLDGRYLAVSVVHPARLLVWRLPTQAEAESDAASAEVALVLAYEPSKPASFSFASSGTILASVDSHEVRVWNLESPDPQGSCTVIDEGADIDTCRISPAGDTLLMLVNEMPRIRQILDGEPQPPIDLEGAHQLIHRLDMSPDGRWGLLLSDSGPSYLVDLRHPVPASTVLAITSTNGTMNRHAFSRDGNWLATAAGPIEKDQELQVGEPEYTVRLHDLGSPTRPQEVELKGHEDLVTKVAFSTDGTRLATCSIDRTVRLWDLAELDRLAKVRARLRAEPRDRDALIRDFGFDADNFERDLDTTLHSLPKLIGNESNRLRDRPQLLLGDDAMMQHCQLTDAWLVAAGHRPSDKQTCARLWSTGALTSCAAPVRLSYEAAIDNFNLNQTMAISPDQRWLIILQDCSMWEFHRSTQGSVLPVRLVQPGSFSANVARFSNAGDLLVLNVGKAVIMFSIDDTNPSLPARVLDTGEQDTRFGFFTPDDGWFVAACGKNLAGEPTDVRLWRPHEIDESGSPLIVLENVRQLGECEASPGGRWLTAWNHDTGYVWDLRCNDPRETARTLRGHKAKIGTVLFSPDERFLMSAGDDGQLLRWDLLETEATIEPRVLHAEAAPFASVVADWERRRLFIGDNAGRATILTLNSQLSTIEPREFAGMSGPISGVLDPTGRWLAVRDKQGVRTFDVVTGEQDAELLDDPGIRHLRPQFGYSPDGRWLIVSRQGRIFLIGVQPGAQPAIELLGHHHEEIMFRVTRDSHWLVTIDRAIDEPQGYQPVQTCRIWDLQSPDPAGSGVTLPDLPRGVDRTVISGDDRWLVTSSRDGVRLWPLGTQHLIEIGQRSIGREPNDEERRRYAFTAAALQGIE